MTFRSDIQALRGLAVLLVLLYHGGWGAPAAGYLGVDVFFVISGFLITGMIRKALERKAFSFREFYFRRAKRLLPAAYVTFLATALAAPLFLTSTEMAQFARQMLGAVTISGNVVLWKQSGYFDGAAELKPLLHVWSLSLEEQYYLVLPALLVLLPARHHRRAAALGFVASFALCVAATELRPAAAFYLLPTRAWELALGSLGALLPDEHWLRRSSRLLFGPSLVALAVVPFRGVGGSHPGADALLVCVATLLVILRRHPAAERNRAVRAFGWVGDFSYSLYLVHWPLFAFANNAWVGTSGDGLPASIRALCLALSLLLGYALFRLVENPTRRLELGISARLVTTTAACSAAIVALPFALQGTAATGIDYVHARRANVGLGRECPGDEPFEFPSLCQSSEDPIFLVWGDSFAMHLVPGLVATSGERGVAQTTRSVCGPLIGLAPIVHEPSSKYNQRWAESCLAFNDSVLDALSKVGSIEVVVISSPFNQYVPRGLNLERLDGRTAVVPASVDRALTAVRRTALAVRARGKRLVVVAPPPSGGFDPARCHERLGQGKLLLGAPDGCAIPFAIYRRHHAAVLDFLTRVSAETDVPVVSFERDLCDGEWCDTKLEETVLYRDVGHLSYDGSTRLARAIDLAHRLDAAAR